MRLALIALFVPALARGERYAVVGDVGKWPTEMSPSEVHVGAEGSVEWPAGDLLVLGVVGDLQRVWYSDDECFGFRGFRGDAAGFVGLDAQDPSIASLRYVLQARLGLAWLHEAPTCSSAIGSRDLAGADIAGVVGFEVRGVRVQLVVARPTYGQPNEPIEVTAGVGFVFR
ncbi:MAG: hypothetical protein ACM31C_11125 [Acidobacteriota bacterium]